MLEIKRASVSAPALTWTVPEDTRNISRAGSFSCSAAEPKVAPCTALLILLYCGAEEVNVRSRHYCAAACNAC